MSVCISVCLDCLILLINLEVFHTWNASEQLTNNTGNLYLNTHIHGINSILMTVTSKTVDSTAEEQFSLTESLTVKHRVS